MATLLPRIGDMLADLEKLAADGFVARPADLARAHLHELTPPDRISTLDCAERHRLLPAPVGGVNVRYDRWRTPYNVGPMNDMDLPTTRLGVMVKPSRSGGTAVAENLIFKAMLYGPPGHIGWWLNTDTAVTEYCRNVVTPMFDAERNPDLAAKIGALNNDTTKTVAGYPLEYLAAKDSTFRNREPVIMICDESDAWSKRFAASPRVQIEGRQKNIGDRRKAMILSHADLGWNSGVAAAWIDTSRGIFIGRCAECRSFAAFHATKHWPDTPEFVLDYSDNSELEIDDRLALAERTAAMKCPHCGSALDEQQRLAMIDEALEEGWGADGWMHRGQSLDPVNGIQGERELRAEVGWWIHGLMVKTTKMGTLARDLVAATDLYERTRDPKQLRELLSKQKGEIFEGRANKGGHGPQSLVARAAASDYRLGEIPPGVKFITAAVDPGGRKFDAAFIGWDLEGRSWLIERITLRQRIDKDGQPRDIDVYNRIDDWMLLIDQVVTRTFPMRDDPETRLPVAVVCIDDGDGKATHRAREFQTRAIRSGLTWAGWSRTKLIKGMQSPNAPMVPDAPRKVDRDEEGRVIAPVFEYNVGSSRLKELTHERLAVTEGGPGQCHFPVDVDKRHLREFFGETFTDGKWVRIAANETLDLYGYCEVGRQMLRPDRKDINWQTGALPIWAKPVAPEAVKGGDPAVAGEGEKAAPPSRWGNLLNKFGDEDE